MNVSENLEKYLMENSTEQDLMKLRAIQADLRTYKSVIEISDLKPLQHFLKEDFAPNSSELLEQLEMIKNAACSWVELMSQYQLNNVFHGFADEKSLVQYFLHRAYFDNVTVFASVIFTVDADGNLPPHMVYKIRQNASYTPTTRMIRDKFWFPGPRSWDKSYYEYGFLWVQDIMERSMIEIYANKQVIEPGSYIQEMPYPCYVWNNFLFTIEHILPICLCISWVYSVSMLVQSIVYEKENRLKEVLIKY